MPQHLPKFDSPIVVLLHPIYVYSQTCFYNDHLRDPKFVVVVDRGSLFRGSFML